MNNDKNGSLRKKFNRKQRSQPKENLADKLVQARGSESSKNEAVGAIVEKTSQYETVVKQLNNLVNDFHRESTTNNNKLVAKKSTREMLRQATSFEALREKFSNQLPVIKNTAEFIDIITESVNELPKKKTPILTLTNLVQDNRLNLNNLCTIKMADDLSSVEYLDFSGLESLTDYGVYQFCKKVRANKKIGEQIKFSEIKLAACRYLSLWSLQYLSLASGISLFDLYKTEFKLSDKLVGCERISPSMIVSLEYSQYEHRDHNFTDTAKTVIINEDSKTFNLLDRLKGTRSQPSNQYLDYRKIELNLKGSTKYVNVFETSESLFDIVTSERCLIIITFSMKDSLHVIVTSLMRRLLKVAAKDILPNGILFVGFGEVDQDLLSQIEAGVKNEILKIQAHLTKNLMDIRQISEIDFETEIFLSNQLNMSQQLEYLKTLLSYATLINNGSMDDKLDTFSMKNSTERLKKARILLEESEAISRKLANLERTKVSELSNFSYPPTLVKNVAEAICYLFAKSPSYSNFKKILKQNNFVSLLVNYDKDNISDYVFDKISKFIDMPEFTPEYAAQINESTQILCEWISFLHSYKLHMNEASTPSTCYETITEFIQKNSYFNFCWPIYYGKSVLNNAIEVDKLVQELANKLLFSANFIEIDEHLDILARYIQSDASFESATVKLEQCREPDTLNRRFILAESTRGNYIAEAKESCRFVVTNAAWFCQMIAIVAGSAQTKSSDYKHLAGVIGGDIPVWTVDGLKSALDKKMTGKSSQFIEFLCDMSLVKHLESFVVPIFLLKNDAPLDALNILWPKNWGGHEIKTKLKFHSSLPDRFLLKLLIKYLDLEQTSLAWKKGFINRAAGCTALVSYKNKELTLAVRVLNPETQFNVPTKSYLYFARYLFMEYLLYIKFTMSQYLIGQNTNEIDKEAHLKLLSNFNKQSKLPVESLKYIQIEIAFKDYYKQQAQLNHNFKFTLPQLTCEHCSTSFQDFSNFNQMYSSLYPNFTHSIEFHSNRALEADTKNKLINILFSNPNIILTKTPFNLETFNECHARLYDCQANNVDLAVRVALYFETYDSQEYVELDLTDNTYKHSLGKYAEDFVRSVHSKLAERGPDNSKAIRQRHREFYSNDLIAISYCLTDKLMSQVTIAFNGHQLLTFTVRKSALIYLRFKIDCIQSGPSQAAEAFFHQPAIHITSQSSLIHEAKKPCLEGFMCYNPRRHVSAVLHKLNVEFHHLIERIMKRTKQELSTNRGFLLLPCDFNSLLTLGVERLATLANISYNTEIFSIQMPCLNLKQIMSKKYFYAHLLETNGLTVKKSSLSTLTMALVLISTFAMTKAENQLVLPNLQPIISLANVSVDAVNQVLGGYFIEVCKSFCLFFDKFDSFAGLIKKLEDGLDLENEFLIYRDCKETFKSTEEFNFNSEPICKDCQLSTNVESDFNIEKLDNKYASCQMTLSFNCQEIMRHGSDSLQEKFTNVSKNFSNLMSLELIKPDSLNISFFTNFDKLLKLEINDDQLELLPPSIFNLPALKMLKLSNSNIKSFKNVRDEIQRASHLEFLCFENIHIKRAKKLIPLPKSLRKLHLLRMRSRQIPFALDGSALTELKCTGVPWPTDFSVNIYQSQFARDYDKYFNAKQLTDVFKYFDKNNDGCIGDRELSKLGAFIFKGFERLGYAGTKTNINDDDSDYVYINEDPSGLPKSIFKLETLSLIDLSFQGIRSIPDEISLLINLNTLILESCILLSSISPKLANLPISQLNLNNCLSLKTPPPEVQNRGLNAIMSYLKRLMSGSVLFKRTKLMLVGLGEAGKTSLLNALMSKKSGKKAGSEAIATSITDGINIKEWVVSLEDQSTLTYFMWDFAGQSVYYNTHQFFLSSRALYILVWNVRLGSEYAGLDFWLSSISCHAPGAPIFIVGTHIDQVSLYTLNQSSLKSRFKQIVGFHFVSSLNMTGIAELARHIIQVTLQQKYIGEKIPEAWFNFEKKVKKLSDKVPLVSYDELVEIAESSSLFDSNEILQAIRFLNDLGSLQYFEITGLKDKVVINPQWIVDVMACVVSVKKSCIEDGRMRRKDIHHLWSNYANNLHEWMLKLTETFDLTYCVKDMIIVPCILPDKEPEFDWPEIVQIDNEDTSFRGVKIKEFQVLYQFAYIPGGLFNRMQVRLFNYADTSSIWKNGTLLKKNNHLALITQSKNTLLTVKVQGSKPENIIFLIHEVIEALINEYFHGIKYDYSFPCPDCVEAQAADPCLFSSELLRRASELKAPYLQCHKYFHAISISEMMAMMPIDGTSTLDLNLEYSLRDLKELKKQLKYDILFWYCQADVSTKPSEANRVSPLRLLKELKSQNYKIWSSNNPSAEKMDRVTYAIKESKLILLCVSDSFALDEKCLQVYELTKNIIKKSYILVEFGCMASHKWLTNPQMAAVCSDVRVIMQDPSRYAFKLNEVIDSIERHIQDIRIDKSMEDNPPDVFISYCWSNSHDAVKKGTKRNAHSLGCLDPRSLIDFFKQHNITAWLDIKDMTRNNAKTLFSEITRGMNLAKVIICCFSDDYVKSRNCALEFKFAHVSLKIPIIKVIVGTDNKWRMHELSFLGGAYPEVNFQFEDQKSESYELLLNYVKSELDKHIVVKKPQETNEKIKSQNADLHADQNAAAFQELYELTQRKFLKQISRFCDMQQFAKQYPKLFCVELIEKKNTVLVIDEDNEDQETAVDTFNEIADDPIETIELSEEREAKKDGVGKEIKMEPVVEFDISIRPMCEFEEQWHLSPSYIVVTDVDPTWCSYLARVMTILRNDKCLANELNIFVTEYGQKLLKDFEGKSLTDEKDIIESYQSLRSYFIAQIKGGNILLSGSLNTENLLGLERCELKNGQINWLCPEHVKSQNAKVLTDSVKNQDVGIDLDKYQILEELKRNADPNELALFL